MTRILVIKLSALGDFCLSLGLFERIRAHHPDAHITLMTTEPYKKLGQQCGAFDEVRTIARWRRLALGPWLRYLRSAWRAPYDMVYDLQSNDRTRALRLISPPSMRSGWLDARHPKKRPDRAMLDIATHINSLPQNLGWLTGSGRHFDLPKPFVLLVPGSAPQHLGKRWPAEHYAALAERIAATGRTPVLIGAKAEAGATAVIARKVPAARDLTGQTTLEDIAALAQSAAAAVGNDTGPMHLISVCGCPVVSLFSGTTDPAKSAPRGERVAILQRRDLAHLDVDAVWTGLAHILDI